MDKNEKKQIPAPQVEIVNGGTFDFLVQEGQDQIFICGFDKEGGAVTEAFFGPLAGPAGTHSQPMKITGLVWTKKRIPGEKYVFKTMATNKDGSLNSPEVQVEWIATKNGNGNGGVHQAPPAPAPVPSPAPAPTPAPIPVPVPSPAQALEEKPDPEIIAVTEVLDTAHRDLTHFSNHPEDLKQKAFDRLTTKVTEAGKVLGSDKHKGNKSLDPLREKGLECAKMLTALGSELNKATKPTPASGPSAAPKISVEEAVASARAIQAKQAAQTVAPAQPDLSGRVVAIEGNVARLEQELGKKASTDDLNNVKGELGTQIETGFGDMGKMIANLKPATTVVKETSPNNAGDGNNNGGKPAANAGAPKPERNWLMLLVGILGTLLLIIGVGGWILSSLLGGWILGSKTPTAGITMPMMGTAPLPAAVAPPTSGQPAASAPAQPAALTSEEIKARQLAIRASQADNPELGAPTTAQARAKGSVNATGSNNIVAGRDVTVINHYNLPPTPSGNGGQVLVTPPPTASVTSSDTSTTTTTSTGSGRRHVNKPKCEDRPVIIPGRWSPTLMTGFICVPVAADGSGSEGYWVYQNPPLPGLPQPYGYIPTVPTT